MREVLGLLLTTRWRLKACPRCHGDLYKHWGLPDWACLQCGYAGPTRLGRLPDVRPTHPRMTLLVGEAGLLVEGEA